MPAPSTCSICSREDRGRIDAALRAGTAQRSVAKTFSAGRTALRGHADRCVTGLGRDARPNAKGGRPQNPQLPATLEPVAFDDPAAVIGEYGRLYAESRMLLQKAKTSADLVRIEKAIAVCAAVLDRFAEHFGLFKKDAPMVNIERVLMVDPNVSDEFLRRYIAAAEAGEAVPDLMVGSAGMLTTAVATMTLEGSAE